VAEQSGASVNGDDDAPPSWRVLTQQLDHLANNSYFLVVKRPDAYAPHCHRYDRCVSQLDGHRFVFSDGSR